MKSQISNPYKRWFFVSLLLLIACLSTLGSIYWRQINEKKAKVNLTSDQAFGRFRNHMGFSDKQVVVYNSLLEKYLEHTNTYRNALFQMQEELIRELESDNIDTTRLKKISLEAAHMQHMIRLETFHHLIEIKAISSPDQQEALNFLYNDLMNENRARYGRQHGKGREGRGHKRYQKQ